MRILIAEDDQVLADGLLRALRIGGYAVDRVASGAEADAALASHEFDLLILDLGLPRLHGLDVLRRLRARGSSMPVLILTAADSVEQRVQGLDLGADDYMAKPFSLQELEARVRALTRRGLGTASTLLRHGPLTFDATGRVAYLDDRMIELSARELGLLEVLLQRVGRLVSKEQLVEQLCAWGEEVSNNAIEVYVHRLRKKIEQGPVRIATVRGLGYCLEKIRGVTHDRPRRSDAGDSRRGAGIVADGDRPDAAAAPGQRTQRSLFGEILDWMLVPLLLLWPASVLLTWLVAQHIAGRPFDDELGRAARVLAAQVDGGQAVPRRAGRRSGAAAGCRRPAARRHRRTDRLSDARRRRRAARRQRVAAGARRRRRTPRRRAGLSRRQPGRHAGAHRPPLAAGRQAARRPALVQVAAALDERSAFAVEIVKSVVLPQLVVLPLAVLLVWLALARAIAPLNEVQQRIRSRDHADLRPLDEREVPEEVSPLVRAINDLLERLDRSIGMQKHFLADAAHQLKTPLAGLRMQAELAEREIDAGGLDPQQLKRSLRQIALSSQRAAHMVDQLLAMARAEDKEHAARRQPVDLAALAAQVVRDFVPQALDRRIDLGFEGAGPGRRSAGARSCSAIRCCCAS